MSHWRQHINLLVISCKAFIQELCSITGQEEQSPQRRPGTGIAPVLAECIGNIDTPRKVNEGHKLCCDSFMDPVGVQGIVVFVQPVVWKLCC